MYELIRVGLENLIGEIIRLEGNCATIQVLPICSHGILASQGEASIDTQRDTGLVLCLKAGNKVDRFSQLQASAAIKLYTQLLLACRNICVCRPGSKRLCVLTA